MHFLRAPYKRQKSAIFGTILRPLITVKFFSKSKKIWIPVYDVLADSGADLTVVPRSIGEEIVEDVTAGRYIEIKGVVPNSVLIAFIHKLKVEAANKRFETMVAIADSNDVPPIFGRFDGLDSFDVRFFKGKEIEFT